ncbi:MAG TPA: CHAT domain-containing tetratricopeptide repeat protein [Vicinamibacterales bacterium]|nr:CHAT domain-containing tetratricopeptide repeat protein [Vicinamibacterales bacterium]
MNTLIGAALALAITAQAPPRAAFDDLVAHGREDTARDLPKAAKEFEDALALADQLRDEGARGIAYAGLGNVRFRQGNLPAALETYNKGVAAAEAARDTHTLAELLRGVGLCEQLTGHPLDAIAPLERGLSLAREVDDPQLISSILGYTGLLRGDLGDLRQRDALQLEALTIAETNHLDVVARNLYNNLGAAHVSQGDFEVGLGYLEKALALTNKLQSTDREIAMTLSNIGVAQLRLGRFDRALDQYKQAMARYRSAKDDFGIALVLTNMGELDRMRGANAAAKTELDEAIRMMDAIGHGEGRTEARLNRAWAQLGLNDVAGALATAEEAVSISRQIKYQAALTKSLVPLGEALLRLGRRDDARRAFSESVNLVETSRRSLLGGGNEGESFLEEYIGPYHALIAMDLEDGRTMDALVRAEQAKGRQLFDSIHPGNVGITHAMTAGERQEEQRLTGDVSRLDMAVANARDPEHAAAAQSQLDEAIQRLEAFRARLYGSHPELRYQRADLPPPTDADLALLLPDAATALIEYVVSDRGVFAFVATKDAGGQVSLTSKPLSITRAEVEREAEAFRRQLASRDLTYRRRAATLYAKLLGPLSTSLRGKKQVAIIPDGALWALPFQALVAPSGRHLIEDHAVFYAPSLIALASTVRARHEGHGAPSLLALVAPLPQARSEARLLRAVYGASATEILSDARAREDTWKAEAGKYRVLHLSTHGVLNSTNPMYSYLSVGTAKGSAEDGLLEAREILDLDLHADLVVLSACETARGRFTYGEGMVGMSWAFLVAGTPTTVVSQWKVESTSTSTLMVAFHRQLLASGGEALHGRARALQRASIAMLRAGEHPFSWAAFTVVGDGY